MRQAAAALAAQGRKFSELSGVERAQAGLFLLVVIALGLALVTDFRGLATRFRTMGAQSSSEHWNTVVAPVLITVLGWVFLVAGALAGVAFAGQALGG
ncbi:hypothetical protein [Kitasatospora sp. NPDC101183]|uniref:hypothetical protein n=1 Tax=Kitasatospora sp. NPDC101183 TaxID=3364100 RepID=UPI003824FF01